MRSPCIQNSDDAELIMGNSIAAFNLTEDDFAIDVRTLGFSSNGFNFIGSYSGNSTDLTTGDTVGNPVNIIDPLIESLADNGGLTLTHALLLNSPTVNAADPNGTLTTDQRGFTRPVNNRADIGAFELEIIAPTNDLQEHAIALLCGQSIEGTTLGSTDNIDEGGCGVRGGGEPDVGVWYKFIGEGQVVTASICGQNDYDGRIDVFSQTSAGLGCSGDRSVGCLWEEIHFLAEAGKEYFIYVNGIEGAENRTGNFTLNLACNPCNITTINVEKGPDCGSSVPLTNSLGNYRICFEVLGQGLPNRNEDYKLVIDHIEYPVIQVNYDSPSRVELCGSHLPDHFPGKEVEVFIRVLDGCTWTAPRLFEIPDCSDFELPQCNITNIEVAHVPTCNSDGTYDICLFIEGEDLPETPTDTKLVIDHIEYPIESIRSVNGGWEVCAKNVYTDGEKEIEVFFRAANECTYTASKLFDEPDCNSARLGRSIWSAFKLYPNPSSDILFLETDPYEEGEIRILNHLNQLVYQMKTANKSKIRIHIAELPAGIYYLQFKTENLLQSKSFIHTD